MNMIDLDQLADVWREPSAWEGDTAAGGIDMPAQDLAVSTGQPYGLAGRNPARSNDS